MNGHYKEKGATKQYQCTYSTLTDLTKILLREYIIAYSEQI